MQSLREARGQQFHSSDINKTTDLLFSIFMCTQLYALIFTYQE